MWYKKSIPDQVLAASTPYEFDIDRGHFLNRIVGILRTSTVAATSAGDIELYLDAIQLIANSGIIIWSMHIDTHEQLVVNQYTYHAPPLTPAADVANGIYPFIIDLGLHPNDLMHMLPTMILTDLKLRINTNAITTVDSNATPTFVGTLHISLRMLKNDGTLSIGQARQMGLVKHIEQSNNYGTNAGEIQNNMPLGELYRRIFIIIADDGTKSDTDVDRVIAELDNSERIVDDTWWNLAGEDQLEYWLEARIAGVTVLDFNNSVEDLEDLVDTRDASSFKIIINQAAAGTNVTATLIRQVVAYPRAAGK